MHKYSSPSEIWGVGPNSGSRLLDQFLRKCTNVLFCEELKKRRYLNLFMRFSSVIGFLSNSESFTLPYILKQHGNVFMNFLPKCPVIIFGYATSSVSVPELAKNI